MTAPRLGRKNPPLFVANDSDTRRKILVAHDGGSRTCDGLIRVISLAMKGTNGPQVAPVQIIDAPSAEAARDVLRRTAIDVSFVCLDLPPAPLGGIKLAQELVHGTPGAPYRAGSSVVLVTRSLRWLPRSAAALKALPWVAPEAGVEEVLRALEQAFEEEDPDSQITLDTADDDEPVENVRRSWPYGL